MQDLVDVGDNFPPWVIATALVTISTLLMFLIKHVVFTRIGKAIDRTPFYIDTVLFESINRPLNVLIITLNLFIFDQYLIYSDPSEHAFTSLIPTASKVLLVVAVILFIDGLGSAFVSKYSTQSATLRNSQPILKGLIHTFVYGLGALILLGSLGISVTPLLASLGIGSLAVALALQPTLENFFSGIQLIMDKPIRVGDFVELDSGEQGFVVKIGWRSTWIQMLPNNTVIMPNSLLSKSKIINYYYPEKQLSVPVEVGVHYDSDLEHVERVTLDVAKQILINHEWGIDNYDTFVIFHTFDGYSINFTVMLRTQEYFHRFFVKSAFIKALHKRYAEEGIVIPYPIQAINTTQENPKFQWSEQTKEQALKSVEK